MPFYKHAELFLPDPVFGCRMRDEFDFVDWPGLDSRPFFYHEQVEPPSILLWVEVLTRSGYDETYLINQESVEPCYLALNDPANQLRVWANAYGLLDRRFKPQTSKRVLQRLGAIDFSLFAYASREDTLAELWEVALSGTSPLAGLAASILAGDLLALGPSADALEERGIPRAATVRKWSAPPEPEST